MNIFKPPLTSPPHLAAKDCINLAKLGRLHAVPKHEYVLRPGHTAQQVYLIVSGQIKVSRTSPAGRDVPLFFTARLKLSASRMPYSAMDSGHVNVLHRPAKIQWSA